MSDIVLRTKNIYKKYGKKNVLDNISMEIKQGAVYGFIGLNGAGKSTFIRLVSGLTHPTEGEIELFGKTDTKDVHRLRQNIGMLVESPGLHPNLTAYQNLNLIRMKRVIPGKECIYETLEKVGLTDVRKKKVKKFSLCMKQRLGIGMALIHDPFFYY